MKRYFVLALIVIGLAVMTASTLLLRQDDPHALREPIDNAYPHGDWISADALLVELASETPPLVLDVREAEEYAIGHLAGAVWISPEETDFSRYDTGRAVVVYCSIGWRSAALAYEMVHAGFADVQNLEGGLFAWANENRPMENDCGPTSEAHPYDALWGRLLRPEHHQERSPECTE